ncbi:hypothetical protein [Aquimarina sp. I32.4]|uniref:hypothetical protein n=1 Tax=Aquimarina sp. I32.4 TaxID=2053903 RepID=UPI000CDF020C|nr:hypothetical protein [Aquimarina sp. I32.4]
MKPYILVVSIILFFSCKEKPLDTPKITNQKTNSISTIPVIDSSYIATKTRYFTVDSTTIKGEGRIVIDTILSQSQFVMFGENHGSKVTSQLITTLVPMLHANGFHHTAFEVGPNSAKKLIDLSTPVSTTVEKLKTFNTRYSLEEDYQYPIPFFSGVEDAQFLQAVRQKNMNIWGLDQEYYYAAPYFMDELLFLMKGHPDYAKIELEKEKAVDIIKSWYTQKDANKIFDTIQKSPVVQQYFNRFAGNALAEQMLNDLKISWDIYNRWKEDSHADRISYMRTNFMNRYNEALETETAPKVFLKFGSLHASKILTNTCYDLGDLVTQLAKKNASKATTINSWHRYYINEKGEEEDHLIKYASYYKRLQDFMVQAKRDQWAIINLESIREDILKGRIALPTNGDYHRIKSLIDGYDYQLILPLDTEVTPNKG